jgi:hypothetical protein
MSLLFNRPKPPLATQPTILHALRVQTSAYGGVIPLVFGQNRVPGKLIWYGDFTPIPHTSTQAVGGKGGLGGGHKTETQVSYTYNAAVAIALAFGPIQGLYNVWDTKGKLAQQLVTESYTVPGGGGTYTVSNSANYFDDFGVGRDDAYSVSANDYGDVPRTYSGNYRTRMAKVGTLTGAGQYKRPATGQYQFHAGDAGKTVYITYAYTVPDSSSNGVASSILNLSLFLGAQGQTAWPYLTSNHAGQDLGYTNIAYIASSAMDLGNSGTLPNYTYEIIGRNPFGAGFNDANPSDIINALLTDALIGCGWPAGNLGSLTAYSNYCISNSLFISPVIDSQRPAREIIQEFLDATNSACYFSEGLLKFVPYGDTTTIGNGVVYTPKTTPIYDLTDDDFLDAGDGDPIIIQTRSWQDSYNSVKVEWLNRSNSYNPEILEEKNQGDIELHGLRPANPVQAHFITTQDAAAFAANTQLKRNVYIRKTYKFTLGWRYCLLEPMDLITLTDSRLGLNKTPVRITSIDEDEDGKLSIEAEEFPWGTATATRYPKQSPTSFAPESQADAGNVNAPIIYEATSRASQQDGYELWIGVSGSNPKYGGCSIWVSADNSSFKKIGVLYGSSRMGVLTANLPSASDPDTTDTCSVDLSQSLGQLSSGSAADCDNFRTLCMVTHDVVTVTDSFPGSSLGAGWTVEEGTFTISSNSVGTNTSAADGRSLAVRNESYPADHYAQAAYTALAANNQIGVAVRGQAGVNTWYAFHIDASGVGSAALFKVIAGTVTVLASAPVSVHVGDTIRLEVVGTQLTAKVNGEVLLTATDSSISTGAPGIEGGGPGTGAGTRIGSFICGSGSRSELISYQTATLTSAYHYNLTTRLRRGIFGSGIFAHATGAKFLRIDDAVFKFTYDPQWKGQTVYFKFTSFNQVGQKEQSLANATSYAVTISGVPGAIDDATGILFGGQQGTNATYRPLSNPLTATDAGSSATVTIDPFTMRVSGIDLSIFSGSITQLAYNTLYYIYYDDVDFSGGAVVFQATTTKEVALNNLGRYFVGSIRTPVSGAGVATVGNNDGGAGAHLGDTYILSPNLAKDTTNADTVFVPIRNTYGGGDDADNNPTTSVLQSIAATRTVAGFPYYFAAWTSLKLKIMTEVLSAGSQPMQVDYSLDNGATWTNVYSLAAFGTRAKTVDTITLSATQHTAKVQVRYTTNAACNVKLYDAWLEGQI